MVFKIKKGVLRYYHLRDSDVPQKVVIPEGVTRIADGVFRNCKNLKNVVIPDSVTSIGDRTFCNCKSLTKIRIPEHVTSIGEDAFFGCSSLTEIKIPDSVTRIEYGAFSHCTGLKKAILSKNLAFLGKNAFRTCCSLTKINIPNTLKGIGDGAFSGCSGLTEIMIPEGVEGIGANAFYRCKNLKKIIFPESLRYVWQSSFWGTPWMERNKDDFQTAGSVLLRCRKSDRNIVIPDGIKTISDDIFGWNFCVVEIFLPESVSVLYEDAFKFCVSLVSVHYCGFTLPYEGYLNIETVRDAIDHKKFDSVWPISVRYALLFQMFRKFPQDKGVCDYLKNHIDELIQYAIDCQEHELYIMLVNFKYEHADWQDIQDKFKL